MKIYSIFTVLALFCLGVFNLYAADKMIILPKDRKYTGKIENEAWLSYPYMEANKCYEVIINDSRNPSGMAETAEVKILLFKNDQKSYDPNHKYFHDNKGNIKTTDRYCLKIIAPDGGITINLKKLNKSGTYSVQVKKIDDKIKIKNYYPNKATDRQKDFYYCIYWLTSLHPAVFNATRKDSFERQVNSLYDKIQHMDNIKYFLVLKKIFALVADGHTNISQPRDLNKKSFPLFIRKFKDGFFVTASKPEWKDFIGMQLIEIDDQNIADIAEKLLLYNSAENKYRASLMLSGVFGRPLLLKALNVIKNENKAEFVFVDKKREKIVRKIESLPIPFQYNKLLNIYKYKNIKKPLYEASEDNYHYEYIAKGKILYFQYNSCRENPKLKFADFNREMFASIKTKKPEKIIIDIRYNGGGFSDVFQPFVNRIKNSYLNNKKSIYVIISPYTYSSAMFVIRDLQKYTDALFLGEPTGNRLNRFGQTFVYYLPYSKRKITISTKDFNLFGKDQDAFYPDKMLQISSDDYFNGKIPIIDYISQIKRVVDR